MVIMKRMRLLPLVLLAVFVSWWGVRDLKLETVDSCVAHPGRELELQAALGLSINLVKRTENTRLFGRDAVFNRPPTGIKPHLSEFKGR